MNRLLCRVEPVAGLGRARIDMHFTFGMFLSLALFVCALTNQAQAQMPTHDQQEALFRTGLSAYERSDYPMALHIWQELAEQDHAKSQAGIGFLFMRGLVGVLQDGHLDDAAAAFWLRKAAEHGQPEGQMLLGRLYLDGRGVVRDPILAFAWCEIAIGHGAMSGGGCRNLALQQMTSHEDMLKAFELVVDMRQIYPAAE